VLAGFEPRQNIQLMVQRDGKDQDLAARLQAIPRALPPADASPASGTEAATPAALTEIKIPEEPNECQAYIPASYRADLPHGLLIVLPLPGEFKADEFTREWSAVAERYSLLVAAPQARLPNMWLPTETAFVRKVIDHFAASYNIDRTRVVVHGKGASGSMAYLCAFRLRDVVRGVVAVDAVMPLIMARPPDNDPVERLSIVVVIPGNAAAKARIRQNFESLRELKYPVILQELPADQRTLDGETQAGILRWVDTLDQL
jgi:hypothetical protein